MSDGTGAQLSLSYDSLETHYGGLRDLRGTLLRLGTFAALAAGATLPLVISFFVGTPVLILGSALLQCGIICIGIPMLLDKFPIRRRLGLITICVLTSVIAFLLSQVGLYAHDLFDVSMALRNDSISESLRDLVTWQSAKLHSLFVPHKVFGGGFTNNFVWRWEHVKPFPKLTIVHLGMVIAAGYIGIKVRNRRNWCDQCGTLIKPKNLIVLPSWASGQLVDTVRTGRISDAIELSSVAATASLGSGCVVARQLTCKVCGRDGVEVVAKATGSTDTCLLGITSVADELVNALRSAPVVGNPSGVSAD